MAGPLPSSFQQQQLVSRTPRILTSSHARLCIPLLTPLSPLSALPLSLPSPSPLPSLQFRLAPDVSRVLYVKSLPFKITTDDLYDIFGKFGAIRQIRLGNQPATRGKAYVVYEDIFDAQRAVEHLNGFNIAGRYLVVLYHQQGGKGAKGGKEQQSSAKTKEGLEKRREEVEKLKQTFGVTGTET